MDLGSKHLIHHEEHIMFQHFRVDGFAEVSEFKESMDQMLEGLEKTKPAPGHERVLYAGLEEYEEELVRQKMAFLCTARLLNGTEEPVKK